MQLHLLALYLVPSYLTQPKQIVYQLSKMSVKRRNNTYQCKQIIFYIQIYLFIAALGLRCCARAFSSCSELGLLFVAEHELQAPRLQQLWHVGSVVVAHGLSSCGAQAQLLHSMWDFPAPGIKPVSPALAGGFLTTEPPEKSHKQILNIFFLTLNIQIYKIFLNVLSQDLVFFNYCSNHSHNASYTISFHGFLKLERKQPCKATKSVILIHFFLLEFSSLQLI